jgi:hypothetical protein
VRDVTTYTPSVSRLRNPLYYCLPQRHDSIVQAKCGCGGTLAGCKCGSLGVLNSGLKHLGG